MEAEIKKFLLGSENRSEYGHKCEYSDGIGYGDGTGYSDGYGDGTGYGAGLNIDGTGDCYGNGYGNNDTIRFRCGMCGNGVAHGIKVGAGDEYGCGNGNQNSIPNTVIKQFKGSKVYYVDSIPCIFKSVHENYASIEVLDVNSFELTKAFIGKYNNCFAHGKTIRDAIEDARSKYYQSLDFDEVKEKLLTEFKKKGKLTVKELYDWHGILTGSCRFGRTQFQTEHNLKDNELLTLEEFINLTKNSFGGDKILKLK